MASRREMYGSGSRRGNSMRATSSVARARLVPGAFDAEIRAEERSFFTRTGSIVSSGAQSIQRRQGQTAQSAHDEFGADQLVSRIARGYADEPKARALRGLEPPSRIFDGHRATRIESPSRRCAQTLERESIRLGRRLALRRVARCDDGAEQIGDAGAGD